MTENDYSSTDLKNIYYTEADIEANRQGILTQDQFHLVEDTYQTQQRIAWEGCKVCLACTPILLIALYAVVEKFQTGKIDYVIMALIFLAILGLLVFTLLRDIFTILNGRDARDKLISVVEGQAHVIKTEKHIRGRGYRGRYNRYRLRLNGHLFRFVNQNYIRQIENGKLYRVYYIKFYRFPVMLSAEML